MVKVLMTIFLNSQQIGYAPIYLCPAQRRECRTRPVWRDDVTLQKNPFFVMERGFFLTEAL